ncbi:hypothetical protein CR513_10308, partial [Mucuna pruriens]
MEPFDGSQDPYAHLQAFQTQMYISGGNDRLSCKLFLASKVKKLEVVDLFDVKQTEGESLKSYLARFNNAAVRVDDPDQNLRAGPFSDALALRRPASMEEIRARAEKHVEVEEDQLERRKSERGLNHKDVRHLAKAKEDKRLVLARANDPTQHFTPLTEKRTQILCEICYTTDKQLTLGRFSQGRKTLSVVKCRLDLGVTKADSLSAIRSRLIGNRYGFGQKGFRHDGVGLTRSRTLGSRIKNTPQLTIPAGSYILNQP